MALYSLIVLMCRYETTHCLSVCLSVCVFVVLRVLSQLRVRDLESALQSEKAAKSDAFVNIENLSDRIR